MRNQSQSVVLERPSVTKHESERYVEALTLIERLHRRLLDVIKDEFERQGDPEVNAVQALLSVQYRRCRIDSRRMKTRGHYQVECLV